MQRKRLMIIGTGVLGGQTLDLLLRSGRPYEVIVASRNGDRLRDRANLAELVAINLGYTPTLQHVELDLNNIDQTAATLARLRPDVIFNAATLQTFWLISTLPKSLYARLDQARVGPWLPMHLVLALKLMRAVKSSGIETRVVNGAYPDAVNAVLGRVGLAPDVGIGNVANAIPALRKGAALQLAAPLPSIEVRLYAHHFVSNCIAGCGNTGGAPFVLVIMKDGVDVSSEVDVNALLRLFVTDLRRTRGVRGQIMAASSAARIIEAIAMDADETLHAPGPQGLPGGYAVRVNKAGADVVLPSGFSLKDVIAVNEQGQIYDGIEAIAEDGTVTFCEREMWVMRDVLGYYCKAMSVPDAEERALELTEKYAELARSVGTPSSSEPAVIAQLSGR